MYSPLTDRLALLLTQEKLSVHVPSCQWAPRLASFDASAFHRDSWGEHVWESELTASDRRYLMLTAPVLPMRSLPEIVAVGGVYVGDDADILTVAVAPRFRRRGIASALVEELVSYARSQGASRVFLEVRSSDTGAQELYRRLCFEPIALRKRYYSDDDAVVMLRICGVSE